MRPASTFLIFNCQTPVYDTDLEDISQKQQELWEQMNEILSRLGRVS